MPAQWKRAPPLRPRWRVCLSPSFLRGSPFAVRVAVQGGCFVVSPLHPGGRTGEGRRCHADRVLRHGCGRAVSCALFSLAGVVRRGGRTRPFPGSGHTGRRGVLARDRKRSRTSRYSGECCPSCPAPKAGRKVRVKGATPPCGGRGGKAPCLSSAPGFRRARGE